jgi:hypothetical protein
LVYQNEDLTPHHEDECEEYVFDRMEISDNLHEVCQDEVGPSDDAFQIVYFSTGHAMPGPRVLCSQKKKHGLLSWNFSET